MYTPNGDNHQISPQKIINDKDSRTYDKFPKDKVKDNDKKLGTWNTEKTCDDRDLVTGIRVSVSMFII